MLSPVKRTLEHLFPQLVQPDDAFAKQHLTLCEWQLYQQMNPSDRQHGLQVAQMLGRRYPDSSSHLLRAAILHDVGKSHILRGRWQVVPRILFHLFPEDANVFRWLGLHSLQRRYHQHASIGASMLQEVQGCARVIELIAKHHQPAGDDEAEILAEVDAFF